MSAHLLVEIYERLPILLVEDRLRRGSAANRIPRSCSRRSARARARRQPSSWRSVFEPTVIDPARSAATDLSRFRCVILANVAQLAPAAIDKLEALCSGWRGRVAGAWEPDRRAVFQRAPVSRRARPCSVEIDAAIGDPNDREKFFAVRASPTRIRRRRCCRTFSGSIWIARAFIGDINSNRSAARMSRFCCKCSMAIRWLSSAKLERGRVLVQGVPWAFHGARCRSARRTSRCCMNGFGISPSPVCPRRNLAVGESIVERRGSAKATLRTHPAGRADDRGARGEPAPPGRAVSLSRRACPASYSLTVKGEDGQAHSQILRPAQSGGVGPGPGPPGP